MTPTENAEQAALFQWAELASGAHPELRFASFNPQRRLKGRKNSRNAAKDGR